MSDENNRVAKLGATGMDASYDPSDCLARFVRRMSIGMSLCVFLFGLSGSIWAADEDRVAGDAFDGKGGAPGKSGYGWSAPWMLSAVSPASVLDVDGKGGEVLMSGTMERNNPMRRELAKPYRERELFVRFQFRYDPDNKGEDNSEFFVLWLDRLDGGDRATHGDHVPNIGVHVADQGPKKGKVEFIVRIGPSHTAWSTVELKRGWTYQVVARLKKSEDSERADYDQVALWVDPKPSDLEKPAASIKHPRSVSFVRWLGFSTGRKTEKKDRIFVNNLVLSRTWEGVLDEAPLEDAKKLTKNHLRLPKIAWGQSVDFKRDVYPLLKKRCFKCHKGTNPESGYRLDVRSEVLGYSTGEPLLVPGNSLESKLIEHVAAKDLEKRMPPDGEGEQLSEKEIALLVAWIDQGFQWDDKLLPEPNGKSEHWAFQAVARPKVPDVKNKGWAKTDVDAFIAMRQEEKGVKPSSEASRHTLIRRLSLDLIGLPPTPEEVAAFVKDNSPNAYRRLVDRLLDSPHYGERWGRYWLDLARWAESHGYQHDIPRPFAWRYREYVVESFNKDKPYDRFLKEQIAGDEIQPYTDENLVATGFLAAARISGNNMDKSAQRNDVLIDIVNATSSAVLGLTMECAQCHNHKFDPLSQRDYYRLQAFFVNGQLGNLSLRDSEKNNPTNLEHWMSKGSFAFYMREAKKLRVKGLFAESDEPHTWGFYSVATGAEGVKRMPVVNRDPIAYDPERLKSVRARLLIRGDVSKPGPELDSGWPVVLGKTPASLGKRPRVALADWMANPGNPLVSRVWVNRLWQYHFGQGIVSTPSNFGTQGAKPSHPELLDWLSAELMDNEWSTKHIHRLIVMSNTYKQVRKHDVKNASLDPDNNLLWNWPRRRLQAEAIRDSVLLATGELDASVGGPSVPVEREESELRRTIYLAQRRSEMPAVMKMFDGPESVSSCSARGVSTVALQPLFLLNSEFMTHRADALAGKVRSLAGDDLESQIKYAFSRTLGRQPESEELKNSKLLLDVAKEDKADALARFCLALLNVNEFLYIP